jgi:hypothetical protein
MPDNAPSVAKLALACTADIRSIGPENLHALISCSKSKSGHRDTARNMYVSPLYRKSALLAEKWGLKFSILSAKYGLLHPDQVIEPYDLTLKGASKQAKREWAERVDAQIRSTINQKLVILAGDDYFAPLTEAGKEHPLEYLAPMRGLSLGNRLAFLNEAIRIENRRTALARAYVLFEEIAQLSGARRLRDLLSDELPSHGVYFFFDDNEATEHSRQLPRLVRIGTHGVSLGSNATLRNRLRTHLGTRAGAGNHRSSVFRLHVGRAIIEQERLQTQYPDWGKGQSASRDVTDAEKSMELRVSKYIGDLRVLFIPVIDTAGTGSMRATIERQFIALLTEHHCPIETSSPNWLGRYSDKPTIRETGLWNVRDVGSDHDVKFIPFLENLLDRNRLRYRETQADAR